MKNYKLYIPWCHGNAGKDDFYQLFSKRYEIALKVKNNKDPKNKNLRKYQDKNELFFYTEQDKYNYWYFWTYTEIGMIILSIFKENLAQGIIKYFIPYLWWADNEECLDYFHVSKEDILKIKDIIWTKKYYEEL